MAACSECGAASRATDFCDNCGAALGAPTPAPPKPAAPAPPAAEECAACGAVRYGRFCEECGHDATQPVPEGGVAVPTPAPAAPPQETWTAVVSADRAWFEEVRARNGPDAAGLAFPQFCPERRFPLVGRQLTIGRRSRQRGVEPEIDLTGPPLDPGVSTVHAMLVPAPDTGWQVVDLDSTNGTTVGDGNPLLTPNTPRRLADGDRIKIGAWTIITVHRD
ncbi:FHA domain-containing protein [Pseudonocardia sp. CA-107938]|uniref:FHA domain-containing protein n=1 Tax=Pseudonocardia sp. CA-107938 TaxID=3240021 RepID=UPI003D909988